MTFPDRRMRLRIAVIYGGNSPERSVSLESGRNVAQALRDRGHAVHLIDSQTADLREVDWQSVDVAFPMVHGTGGEDGVLQCLLDRFRVCYVGSSAQSSALTFSKWQTRIHVTQQGIRMPRAVSVDRTDMPDRLASLVHELNGTLVTKPDAQGSSVGVSIVRSGDQLVAGVQSALAFGDRCVIEEYVEGREVTVPIIDGMIFPAVEIRPDRDWYDYDAKYTDDNTTYRVAPTDVPASIGPTALRICRLTECSGIARVDFRVDQQGVPWLLEVNSIPGMTAHSLVPMSIAAAGYSMGEVCENVIRHRLHALARRAA